MTPLSHRLRLGLLATMVVAFVIGAPLLIGYSQGYRIDDALGLIQTGGIYIHSDVGRTNVFLEGEFLESRGQFLRNTFVQTLFPGRTYSILVERDGYHSWMKDLPVYRKVVTEARVMMLPIEYVWSSTTATATVETRSVRGVMSTTTVPNPEYQELQVLFANTKDQFAVEVATSTTVMVRGQLVATTTSTVELVFPAWAERIATSSGFADGTMVREREGVVAWLRNGDLYATWVRDTDRPPFYFCMATCTPMLKIDWEEPIERYAFFPNRNDVVIVGSSRGIYAVELDDRSQRNIQPIRVGRGLSFRMTAEGEIIVFDGEVYWKTRL